MSDDLLIDLHVVERRSVILDDLIHVDPAPQRVLAQTCGCITRPSAHVHQPHPPYHHTTNMPSIRILSRYSKVIPKMFSSPLSPHNQYAH